MSDLLLPQPNKNARSVVKIVGLLADILGYGVIKELGIGALDRNLEKQQGKIIEAIKAEGIDVLDEEQAQFFIPNAMRFYEQVRLGEYDHNLSLLRKILIDGLKLPSSDSGKIGRHARQLEYLSQSELDVLAAAFETQSILSALNNDDGFVNVEMIKVQIPRFQDIASEQIKWALNVLNSRGLLVVSGASVWDGEEDSYSLSPDAKFIIEKAVKK